MHCSVNVLSTAASSANWCAAETGTPENAAALAKYAARLSAPTGHLQLDVGNEEVVEEVSRDELPKRRPRPQPGVALHWLLRTPLFSQTATHSRYDRQQERPRRIPEQCVNHRLRELPGAEGEGYPQVSPKAFPLGSGTQQSFETL